MNKAVADLVSPFNRKLGPWQATSVKLNNLVQRNPTGEGLAGQLGPLFDEVNQRVRSLEAVIREAGPSYARHSRVEDTRRSFRMVLDRLMAIKALLIGA